MAYPYNSPVQSQHSRFQSSPTSRTAGEGSSVRRTQSFDPGDDGRVPEGVNGTMAQSRGYRPGPIAVTQQDEPYIDSQSPSFPPRSTSYGTAGAGGYQRQDSPSLQPGARPLYNPQQYGAPQHHYSPQLSGATANTFSASYTPYVPAAYQPTSSQYQSNYGSQPHSASSSYSSNQPPPPPPRPIEQRYGNRVSPQIGFDTRSQLVSAPPELPYRQQPLPPLPTSQPPSTGSPYTPPAPPPPPFSPGRDAFPSNTITAPSQSYSQRLSASRNVGDRFSNRPPSLHNQLPPLPNYSSNGSPRIPSPAIHRRPVGLNNSLPPTPGTPGPTPPQHSPQRNDTIARHPQARPLPGPPAESTSEPDYFSGRNGSFDSHDNSDTTPGYDDLMQEVEAAVMGRAPPSSSRRSPRVARTPVHASIDETQATQPFSAQPTEAELNHGTSHLHPNGPIGEIAEGQYVNYDAYSDRSDAEAEAGLAAMHMADEQDAADEARRQSGRGSYTRSGPSQQSSGFHESSSDSDVNIDMDTYGGGFSGNVPYGDSYGYANQVDNQGRPFAQTRVSQRSDLSGTEYDYPIPGQEYIHPFAPARVDRAGTGGLSEPGTMPRRLSFEDGDEATLVESEGASGTQSPSRDTMPEMFFHPGVGTSRPLPAAPVQPLHGRPVPQLMPAGTYQYPERLLQYDQYGRPTFPAAPDAYNQLSIPQGMPVPRSSSLISHSSTPQTVPPIRSKTDADRAKILRQQQQQMGLRAGAGSVYGPDSIGDASMNPSAEVLGLPEIPVGKRRKFNPSKLSTTDFKRCAEPWALSSVVTWVKEMSEGEADLKEHAIVDGIVALFTHKVPTMNTADAENLGAKVVRSMYDSGTLFKEEEWVKFGTADMSGVLFQLTGTGCYSPRVHTEALPGRCYSHHCMRTLKKINLHTQALEPQRKAEDWPTFYKITKADIENIDRKEVERQNNLHEIVTTEDDFMDQLNVLRVLYRDELAKWQPPILAPKRIDKFLWDVFGRADAIQQVNEDYLLAQLKYRQQEQGPWIVGFSDIFREWIRKAKNAYIEYAAAFPNASYLIRQESDRNILFRQFLDQMRANDRSRRLGWDTYLKAPITRLQRYTLLLSTVHKNTVQDSEEKSNLAIAIEEIKVVTLECDARVAEMTKNVDLAELSGKLQLRPGMDNVQLNLTHLGREIHFQGDLQRTGKNKFGWVDTHAILFDHYLVLAKIVSLRDAAGGLKYEKYDVSKHPIPMDLLVLESKDDPPVIKSTMKGLGTVTTITTRAETPQETRASRQSMSSPGPGALVHTNTASSVASTATNASSKTLTAATVIDSPKDEKIMFPFKFKHLGRDNVYTLYAPTHQNRSDWCNKITEAKTRHAASLYKQGAEPFRLRVVADTAFAYDAMAGMGKTIVISGTPLDRAIREVEEKYKDTGPRPNPICRAAVNCATAFNQPYGNSMVAIGTDYGVYISNYGNPRVWTRAIQVLRVTQIAVLEEFSLFLLISDKSLIAYHLDSVCPASGTHSPSNASDSARRAPQKLSGTRDVGFFAHGRQKDRALVFYKKREGASSIFKVLEPVYQKSSTSSSARSRFGIKKGSVEFFREFDDFYIGSETYTINLFHSSIAISTAKGIEVMNLDKKLPISVPDLKPPDCASIAHRIRDQKPLGMFRLSDSEFLLVFEEVGIYVNKHGDVSRAVVLEFVGKAKQAALCNSSNSTYLILVDHAGGYVEVRNAVNGRLRQMISGRDVRLLDDGTGGAQGSKPGTVKLCMQHPEWERSQIVVEMVVNEGLKE